MTAAAVPLTALVTRAADLLLDFDGPVCRLFAGHPAPTVAEHLRGIIAAHGLGVPMEKFDHAGPLRVLRLIADLDAPRLTRRVADALRDAEVRAAASATPTPAVEDVLHAARASGRRVAVVSNNAVEAARAYLDAHDLSRYVDRVVARYDGMDPRQLKPDPHLVHLSLGELDASPSTALFVGDSLGDIEAGRATGVPVVGYANKPGKRQAMLDAKADAIIDTMAELADALSEAPRLS